MQLWHGKAWEIDMKMSKVAKMVGVDRRTIYNWVTHKSLEKLFSKDARNSGKRYFNEEDIFIVNTIHHLRQNVTDNWEKIAEQIESGYIITDLSIGAVDVDTGKTPLQQFTRTLAIAQERDLAIQQLEEVQEKLEELAENHKAEIKAIESEHKVEVKTIESDHKAEIKAIESEYKAEIKEERQQSIGEIRKAAERESKLSRELGKLEAKLELLQEQHEDK
jgi:DNA-binding transcriptional MerR regulator